MRCLQTGQIITLQPVRYGVTLDNRYCVWAAGIALPRVSPWKLRPGWSSVPSCALKLWSVSVQLENLAFTTLNHWDICSTRHAASVYKLSSCVYYWVFRAVCEFRISGPVWEKGAEGTLEPAVPKRNQNFTLQGQNGFPQLQNPRAWWLAEQSQPLLCCLPCEWRGKQLSTGHRAVCLAEQDPDSFRTLTLSIFLIERTSRCFTVLFGFCCFVLFCFLPTFWTTHWWNFEE